METAEIVKVAVSAAPYSIDRPFDYQIPAPLLERALPGVRVTVPFGRGNRTSEGIILARGSGEKLPGLKPLEAVLDDEPVLDSQGIALALWMRQRRGFGTACGRSGAWQMVWTVPVRRPCAAG